MLRKTTHSQGRQITVKPILSIVIPSYKRTDSLKNLLESISGQIDERMELIVVDQSPGEEIIALASAYTFVRLIRLEKPSLPHARNIGIRQSSGRIILFLDDDTIVHEECLNTHIRLHNENDMALIAGRSVMSGNIKWAAIDLPSRIDRRDGSTLCNFDLDDPHETEYATGCHFSLSRELAMKTGLFDCRFRGNALYEDVDFSLRLRRLGGRIIYSPLPVVDHLVEESGGCRSSAGEEYLLDRIFNSSLFYSRHLGLPRREFILLIRNIAESLSRRENASHDRHLLLRAAAAFAAGMIAGRRRAMDLTK